MSRGLLLALLVALSALAPGAHAAPEPEFPSGLLGLADGWIADAEAAGAPHRDKEWYPEAESFLESAREARAEGRLRSVMFDLETFHELVLTGALVDEATTLGPAAEGKSLVLQRTGAWHAEARGAWEAYRERLREMQADIGSVRGMEIALYGTDQAIGARLLTDDRENLAREFPKQPGVDRGYVLGLVRASHTAVLELAWASDILEAAAAHEGVPPRLNRTMWDEIVERSLTPIGGNVPQHLQALEAILDEARERNETILAVTLNLAEQRVARATSIFVIYGDATSRGKNVTEDATRAMANQLENVTMEEPREFGLLGVFTADAIDRARKTSTVAESGLLNLGVVISAWAALDHQAYVTSTLGAASPVQPARIEEPPKETPLGLVALAALAVAAFALRRR